MEAQSIATMHDVAPRRWGQEFGLLTLALALLWALLKIAERLPAHPALAALAVLGLLLGLAAVWTRPEWGGLALILIAYWNASEVLTIRFGFAWLLRGAIAWTLLGWLLQATLPPGKRIRRWPLARPLALYVAVQLLSVTRAAAPGVALAAVMGFGKDVAVFYMIVKLLPDARAWRRGLLALLAATALLALPVDYQMWTGSHFDFWGFGALAFKEIVPGVWGLRPGGALGDPNFLALILVAALPVALMLALAPGQGWWRRGFSLLVAGLAGTAIVATYSRGALLGLAALALALLWRHPRRRRLAVALALATPLLVPLLPRTYRLRMATLAQVPLWSHQQMIADSSFRERRGELLVGLRMAWKHPLLGVGVGNYTVRYRQYAAAAGLNPARRMDPHNLYVQIAAETGLAGLTAFVYLVATALRRLRRARRTLEAAGGGAPAQLAWGLELGIWNYLLVSLFLHSAYFRHFLVLLALGMLIVCLSAEAEAETAAKEKENWQPTAPALETAA